MPQEHSAGAIIFRNENGMRLYMVLHYVSGHWDFMKGHIEKGESAEETIKREAVEETGLRDLQLLAGFEENVKYFFKRGGATIGKDVTFRIAETKTEKISLDSPQEHQGFAWLPYDRALARTTFETAKGVLRKAEAFLNRGSTGLGKWVKP